MRFPFSRLGFVLLPFVARESAGFSWPMAWGWACGLFFLTVVDEMTRGARAPRYAIFMRMVIPTAVFSLGVEYLAQEALGHAFIGYPEMILGSCLAIIILVIFGGMGTWVGDQLLTGDRNYDIGKQLGRSHFWDTVWWPFNPDPDSLRATGLREPVTSFVPPSSWSYQCPVCGARNDGEVFVCWNCDYGADGDATAYYRRLGVEPPTPARRSSPVSVVEPEEEPGLPFGPVCGRRE